MGIRLYLNVTLQVLHLGSGSVISNQHTCYKNYQKMKELEEKWRGVAVLDDEVQEEMKQLTRLAKCMTEERIKLLHAEDFVWGIPIYLWELRFQQLQTCMDANGHAPIMSKKVSDPLASWVNT